MERKRSGHRKRPLQCWHESNEEIRTKRVTVRNWSQSSSSFWQHSKVGLRHLLGCKEASKVFRETFSMRARSRFSMAKSNHKPNWFFPGLPSYKVLHQGSASDRSSPPSPKCDFDGRCHNL